MPIHPRWTSRNQELAEQALEQITDDDGFKQVAMSPDATERTRMQAVFRMRDIALLREVATIKPEGYPADEADEATWRVGREAGIQADELESIEINERLLERHDFHELVEATLTSPLPNVARRSAEILMRDFEDELTADRDVALELATKSPHPIAHLCEECLDANGDLMLVATRARYDYARGCAIRRLPMRLLRWLIDEGELPIEVAAEALFPREVEELLREGYSVPVNALRELTHHRLEELAKEGVLSGDDLEQTGKFRREELESLAHNDGILFRNGQYGCHHAWETKVTGHSFTDRDGWRYVAGDSYRRCRRCDLVCHCPEDGHDA